jgi:hypothetical protein
VPVLAWSNTMGMTAPHVSVNHNFTPGSSAEVPEAEFSAAFAVVAIWLASTAAQMPARNLRRLIM